LEKPGDALTKPSRASVCHSDEVKAGVREDMLGHIEKIDTKK